MYVLNKGLLGFLDTANLKFIAPGVHKILHTLFFGKKVYQNEFVDKKENNMIGDFTAEKKWHTHYSFRDLKKLSSNLFTIKTTWYYSFFLPILMAIEFLYVRTFSDTNKFLSLLIRLDNRISNHASYCLIVENIKPKQSSK